MAIVKPGPLVGAISGPVGAVIFRTTKNGTIAAHRPTRLNAESPLQTTRRAQYERAALNWRTLTPFQHAAWATYAAARPYTNRLGQQVKRTGYEMYMLVNLSTAAISPILADNPPRDGASPAALNVTLTWSGGGLPVLSWDAQGPSLSRLCIVYLQRTFSLRRPRRFPPAPYAFDDVYDTAAPSVTAPTTYIDLQGQPQPGEYLIAHVRTQWPFHFPSPLSTPTAAPAP